MHNVVSFKNGCGPTKIVLNDNTLDKDLDQNEYL